MKYKSLAVIGMFVVSGPSVAAGLINEMQSCQGLLDFVEGKLQSAPASYPSSDVQLVRKGLSQYNDFIQQAIVSPGILKFNGGDSSKAQAMQVQVNAYKASLVAGLNDHYRNPGLYSEVVVAINGCTQKAAPSGELLEDLRKSVIAMASLSLISVE